MVAFDKDQDAQYVGEFLRGGGFEIWKRIARNTPDFDSPAFRPAVKEFAKKASIHFSTVDKYLATGHLLKVDGVLTLEADEIEDGYDWEAHGLTQEVWLGAYKRACQLPPPWKPHGRPLEPRTGANRHVSKASTELTLEQLLGLVKDGDATAIKKLRQALRKVDADRDLDDAKDDVPDAGHASAEQVNIMNKFDYVEVRLKDLIGLVANIRGDNAEAIRIGVRSEITKARMLLDAIEIANNGESMDAELAAMLGGA